MLPRRWVASILERIERISFSRLELGMGWLENLEGRVGGGAGWEGVGGGVGGGGPARGGVGGGGGLGEGQRGDEGEAGEGD